jgi:nucleoside-diphosphate-sugar epimerase
MGKRMKALLIGGPGNISASTVRALLDKGFEVGIFTLPDSPGLGLDGQVRFYRGDRNHPEELAAAVQDFKPEAVLDFVCFNAGQARQAADIVNGRVGQYVFVSSVDVYGYPLSRLPMREYDPKGPGNCRYAADKAECEEVLLARAEKDGLPLTIARPVYSFGPEFVLDLLSRGGGRYMIPRLRAGMPILVPGGGNTLIQVSSAYNTGRMIAQLAGHSGSIGKTYNCGHPAAMTHDEYVGLFARAVGKEPRLVHIPFEILLSLGLPEIDGEILPILSRFHLSFSTDAFRADFPDFRWELSLEDAAGQYVAYNDRAGTFADPREEYFADRIIKAWQERVRDFSI